MTTTLEMQVIRTGRITSSCIGQLMGKAKTKDAEWSAPALTYMQEKIYERLLGRSLNTDMSARATTWGTLVELHAFGKLGTEYRLCSTQTIQHPEIY